MKVLIAGGGGLVGTHLCAQLAGDGHDVWSTSRTDDARCTAMRSAGVHPIVVDIADPAATDQFPSSVDAVVYLAQSSRFREFPAGSTDMIAVNAAAPVRVAQWAAEHGATTFVNASTGAVYAPSIAAHHEDEPLDLGGLGFYPASKLAGEIALRAFAPVMRTIMLRPFFVYGPGMNPTMLMNSLVNSIRGGQTVRLMGHADGLQFQPTPGVDAARQVAALLTSDAPGGVFNIAASAAYSLREVAEAIGRVVGAVPVLEHVDGPPQAVLADTSRISAIVEPSSVTLERGIRLLCGE